jgi:hypothetical protein
MGKRARFVLANGLSRLLMQSLLTEEEELGQGSEWHWSNLPRRLMQRLRGCRLRYTQR